VSYRRRDLRPGDVLLVRDPYPWSAVIRWVTHAPVDHAALVTGGSLVEDRFFTGVRRRRAGEYVLTGDAYRVTSGSPAQGLAAARWAQSQVGQPYGWVAALRGGIADWWRRRVGIAPADCSLLVARAWRAAGVDLTPGVADPTPGDLLRGHRLVRIVP